MKTRYLVIGFAMVMAISLVGTAFGGPLSLRASSPAHLKTLVKKALKAATAANQLAEAAQGTATGAQSSANNAQATATAAKTAASGAQTAAAAAKTVADGAQTAAGNAQTTATGAKTAADTAQSAANAAQTKATSAETKATTAETKATTAETKATTAETAANSAATTAQNALNVAGGKYGGEIKEVTQDSTQAFSVTEKSATAMCPANSTVVGGGFKVLTGAAEPHISDRSGNGWFVDVQSGGNGFNFTVFAYCLTKN